MLRIVHTRNVLLSTLAVLFLFVSPLAASAQYTEAQEIELRRGWNEITLQVQPEDLRFDAILADVLEHVVIVENEDGEKYVPSDDINQITDWDLDEAYRIHVEEDVTLAVEGEPYVSTEQVNLTTGWNLLPFYLNSPIAAKTVMDQMGSGVIALREGVDGRMYHPEENQTDLEVLEPGHGYYVLADRNARVRPINDLPAPGLPQDPGTPGDPNDPGAPGDDEGGETGGDEEGDDDDPIVPSEPEIPSDADLIFDTMEEMLAYRGFEVGQTVAVRGYYEPGDNGGGVFDVTDNGCAPDGATCYVPEEHQEEAVPATIRNDNYSGHLAHDNLVFGSVKLYYNDNNYISDLQLHGHRRRVSRDITANINHATGHLTLSNGLGRIRHEQGDGRWVLHYKYATADTRLTRRDSHEGINLRWLGARPSSIGFFDATDHIAWAINHAHHIAVQTGSPHPVIFDDMYYYAGIIIQKNNVILQGAMQGVRNGQGMRVLPNVADIRFREQVDSTNPLFLPKSERTYIQDERWILVTVAPEADFVEVRDFEIDGNALANLDVFKDQDDLGGTDNHIFRNKVDDLFQNSSYYNGYGTIEGGEYSNTRIRLNNVHFHDFGGNVLITNGAAKFDGSSHIKLGNSLRNHIIYDMRTTANGWIDNIELYGYAWGAPFIAYTGNFRNLKISDLIQRTPIGREIDYPVNIRIRGGAHGVTETDGDLVFENFLIDLRGLHKYGTPFFLEGENLKLINGRIETWGGGRVALFYHRQTSGRTPAKVVIEDVDIIDRSSAGLTLTPDDSNFEIFDVRGLRIIKEGSQDERAYRAAVVRPRAQADSRQVMRLENVGYESEVQSIFSILGDADGSLGYDIFVSGSFHNSGRPIGHQVATESTQELIRFYWNDCTFNARSLGPHNIRSQMSEVQINISHFSNCTDRQTGRTSEDSGRITTTADSVLSYYDIPINLFWKPRHVSVDGDAISSYDIVGSDDEPVLRVHFDRPIPTGSPIDILYDTAVHPWPDNM